MVVDNLETTLAEISGRGISSDRIEEIPRADRKAVITDPDGNEISLLQIKLQHASFAGPRYRPAVHTGIISKTL